jgi:hypothetical protein
VHLEHLLCNKFLTIRNLLFFRILQCKYLCVNNFACVNLLYWCSLSFVYSFQTNIQLNLQGIHYCDMIIVLLEGNKIKGLI